MSRLFILLFSLPILHMTLVPFSISPSKIPDIVSSGSKTEDILRTLYITGVKIQGLVTTLFVLGPVYYAYSLAYGHTNQSAATTEAIAAKAPRRIALGYETYIVTAPVGTLGQGVYMPFNSPIVVNPGEYIQVLAKNQGAVTTAGVICVLVAFDGYWE
jgi:hypothetical protein